MRRNGTNRLRNGALVAALLLFCNLWAFALDDLKMIDLQYNEHGTNTRLVITANMPFMYDVREAGTGTLVVETDYADISKLASNYNIGSSVVDMIGISNHTANGTPRTELVIKYNPGYSYSHSLQGRKLLIDFARSGNTRPKALNGGKAQTPATQRKEEVKTEPVEDVRPEKSEPVRSVKSTPEAAPASAVLEDIRQEQGEGWTNVIIELDRPIERDTFKILPVGGPKRFVLDFHHTRNREKARLLTGNNEFFTGVRTALNRIDPYPVTRVVFDQEEALHKQDPHYEIRGDKLILQFGEQKQAREVQAVNDSPAKALAEETEEKQAETTVEKPVVQEEQQTPEKEKKAEPVIVESRLPDMPVRKNRDKPAVKSEKAELPSETPEEERVIVEPVAVESESDSVSSPVKTKPAEQQAEPVADPDPIRKVPAESETVVKKVEVVDDKPVTTEKVTVSKEKEPVVGTEDTREASTPAPVKTATEIPVAEDTMEADETLFDEAFPKDEAEQDEPKEAQPDRSVEQDKKVTTKAVVAGDPEFFQTRVISGQEREYTGTVVDLEFDSIPLSQVILLLGQLTDKNFIVDPSVSNINISMSMKNTPWDKALDSILDYHGLGMVEDGNLIRIATRDKLASEAADKRRLQEERALAVPLRQVAKPINYANASDLIRLLTPNLSKKGQVVVDNRTNTLVITDIPAKVDEHLNLIATLDIPTKQVYVEARIVETTRDFINEIGLQWGFRSSYNQNYGNSTGLIFPNQALLSGSPILGESPNVDPNYGSVPWMVNLPSPEASSSILGSFSNIAGSFALDALLSAAESERKVRVLSRPRISAQNNNKAVIKSGVEVPYQVIQNNTVSIRYREATLKLEVTPHITADSTVIMDVLVDKSSLGVRTDAGFSIQTRQATSTIRVKDGGVAVIGGVLEINDSYTEERTPFFHRLPLVGNLFKNRLSRVQNTELIIFISPKIIG